MNLYGGTAGYRERAAAKPPTAAPFDTKRLDELIEEAGIDVLIASSKHNIQYLLGGYRFFFFDYTDALGLSRYLPLFVYRKGRPQEAFYVGNSMESWEDDLGRFWVPVEASSWGSADAMEKAVDRLSGHGKPLWIGVERAFLPADAEGVLRERMPQAQI